MATAMVSKPSKWFSNKTLKLSLPRLLRSKSKSSSPSSPTPLTPRNDSKEEQLQQVFRHFDTDGDGKISAEELKSYFASIGESMSDDEVQGVIKDFSNSNNLLEFREFVRLIMEGHNEVDDDLRRAFEMYEADKGSGCITPRGLQRMLNRLGDVRSHEECVAIIRVFDLDGNGVLDFHEFHHMMSCPQ
ncbi:hypothetical protein ACOSP7_010847 [Xanthoceras sorbifolium]